MVDSLHCTNCGAPLKVSANQTVAACLYCNSTLRVAPGAVNQPAVTRLEAVPPAVVDEVKRLLVLGNQPKAVEYYAKETGMTEAEAATAVAALASTVGYAPPLNWLGVAMLVGYTVVGVGAIVWAAAQIVAGRALLGVVTLAVGVVWVLLNWMVLGRGIKGFWLTYRGVPAEAVIRQRWTIRTMKAAGEAQPVELVRFLLAVQPQGRAAFETEANGMVRHRSYERTQPGCRMRLKYDPSDPTRVVLLGPVDLP